jgi:DNA-binding transcriptional ArsR family regulator
MIKTPDSLTIARVPKKRNLLGSRENYLEAVAFVARTLADANRLRILLCVHEDKKSVSGIVEELNLSQPLVSHHLRELRRALLVRMERRGPFVYYELADRRILEILTALKDLATDLLAARTSF